MVNSNAVGEVWSGDSAWASCNSNTFVVRFHTNDDVYVKHDTIGDNLFANTRYGLPMFNGALLQEF